MPTNAAGVAKQVRYKVEATFGTAPGASGAQLLRRTQSSLDLSKDGYESNEIADHRQVQDFRHGVRRVAGNLAGELSPATYKDFVAAVVRRDFTALTAISGASITISGSGPTYTVARAAGSWLTDGVKIGHIGRLSVGSFNAANLSKNLMVTAVTALNLTVMPLNGVALVAEGPIATSTFTVIGKQTWAPASGHTDKSFSIEHYFSDIVQSELFLGCKPTGMEINLPPTGMATVGFPIMGKDVTNAASAYYTSPTAATATGIVAAVNGVLLVGGVAVAICTGVSFKVEGGHVSEPVVGSNTVPSIDPGRIRVSGQFSAFFQDATLRDYFINETEITLAVALSTSNAAAADFIAFTLPRLKVNSAPKDDGDKSIIATHTFTGLYNATGGAGISSEQTTLLVQDSAA